MHVSVSTFIQLLKLTVRKMNSKLRMKIAKCSAMGAHIAVFWLKCSAMGSTDRLAHTVVPEIAIQCHRKLKTGPFRIFYTAPMGPLSRVWASQAVVNFWFPLNNLSLLWPIDTKLAVWVAYI